MLRLRAGGMCKRKIAASLSIGMTTAGEAIRRARRAGLSWPLREGLSDEALERPPRPTSRMASDILLPPNTVFGPLGESLVRNLPLHSPLPAKAPP